MTKTVIDSAAPAREAAAAATGRAVAPRAGFIGAGFMATVHSRAARAAGAELSAVASSSWQSAERAADRLGLGRAYGSVDELLADDGIDIVHVCTPNTTHARFALAALDAGKHVICEKPLATTVGDAAALARAGGDRRPHRDRALRLPLPPDGARGQGPRRRPARSGACSASPAATCRTGWPSRSPTTGGSARNSAARRRAFADIGSHLVDLLEFVTGDRIARLDATTPHRHGDRGDNRDIATEDLVALVVELSGGAVGTLLDLAGRARPQEQPRARDRRNRREHPLRPGAAGGALARPPLGVAAAPA